MSIYEEVEIEDMTFEPDTQIYTYACPCGDKFFITLEELYDGEDIGTCPSCTLRIRVIFDEDNLPALKESNDGNDNEENDDSKKENAEIHDITVESLPVSQLALAGTSITVEG